jgi:beta-glucosidase
MNDNILSTGGKAFKKFISTRGQTKTVSFTLMPAHLAFYDVNMNWVIEPGQLKVWVGPNSVEGLEGSFHVASGATGRD